MADDTHPLPTHLETNEVIECLAETIWEKEREPRTRIWGAFWDRITLGEPAPPMPDPNAPDEIPTREEA